jgi:hypothetical protein
VWVFCREYLRHLRLIGARLLLRPVLANNPLERRRFAEEPDAVSIADPIKQLLAVRHLLFTSKAPEKAGTEQKNRQSLGALAKLSNCRERAQRSQRGGAAAKVGIDHGLHR